MNAFNNRLRPDFEANNQLPEWQQMAEQGQSPDISPFVDALKQRMSKMPDTGGLGAAAGGALGGGAKPGGMQSL